MPTEEMLRNYAAVAVRVGLGLEPGDRVLVSAPVQTPDFVAMVVEEAYEGGATSVDVLWYDDRVSRARFSHGNNGAASTVSGMSRFRLDSFEAGASFLRIHAEDPRALAGVDVEKIQEHQRVNGEYLKPHFDAMGGLQIPWSVISAPVPAWNSSVFPSETIDAAEEMMWGAILRACRIDQPDPVGAWRTHLADLNRRRDHLTSRRYTSLRYEGPGTELTLGLTDKALWEGGAVTTPEGRPFAPNLPTEEVFTSPHRDRADGTVTASKPLSYFGEMIEDFSFEVRSGSVVSAAAGSGQAVVDRILETDAGASRFGEAAMVPQSGAVAAEQLVWNNMLFDENDACHIALGQSYAMCFEGGPSMGTDEQLAVGLNQSSVHVDFVVGSPELSVFGVDAAGNEEPIIESGEWAFSV